MAPGPYPYPPPQQQPPQMMPAPIYSPAARTDSKATTALVMGILSLFCCGIFTGIPAIVLGAMSKRDISRSGGTLGGEGMAIGGIVTGSLSTLGTIAYVIFYIVLFATMGTPSSTYAPTPYIPPPTYTTPLAAGAIHTTELTHTGGALKQQLVDETLSAKTASEKVLVYVYLRGAKACTEFDATLSDPDMQRVLEHVRLVRVEGTEFPTADFAALGMAKTTYPWFYRTDTKASSGVGSDLVIVDSISGDEWADNYAYNIYPVLEQFMGGTYMKKVPPVVVGDAGKTTGKPLLKVDPGF